MNSEATPSERERAGRLQQALTNWMEKTGRTKQQFISDLGSGVKGASYPSLNSYLTAETSPPIEFIEAASRVLEVPPETLTFGVSVDPTPDKRRPQPDEAGAHELAMRAAIRRGLGFKISPTSRAFQAIRWATGHFLDVRFADKDFKRSEAEAADLETAERIGRAARAAMNELGKPGWSEDGEIRRFLVHFALAAEEWAEPSERFRQHGAKTWADVHLQQGDGAVTRKATTRSSKRRG
jgi:hypothetical protein